MTKSMRRCICIFFLYLIVTSALASVIERVSVSSTGEQGNVGNVHFRSYVASISANGRFVVFNSSASNLVVGDTNNSVDTFVHDRETDVTERVSVSSFGIQADFSTNYDDHLIHPSISADGRFVAFDSHSTNLVSGDTNRHRDVFVHDRETGTTERVSMSSSGIQGNEYSYVSSISADGRFVAFVSRSSNLVAGGTNGYRHVFVHDRETGTNELVSMSSSGEQGNNRSDVASISANGRYVAFNSRASNLVTGDTNRNNDVFVHDRDIGVTERVSLSSTGEQGNSGAVSTYHDMFTNPSISADGRYVAFVSRSSNLVAGGTNGNYDVFVHDRETSTTERVSVSSSGMPASGISYAVSISADGRFVAFQSTADNLVAGDTNGNTSLTSEDTFVHDRNTGITERVSVSSTGEQARNGYGYARSPSITANGRFVSFTSRTPNLVAGDTNSTWDVFIAENTAVNPSNNLSVTLRPTSGATQVGEYIRFRARLKNNSNTTLTQCNAQIVNPQADYQREFSYYTWPLKVANPMVNGAIDIAPGETGEISMAVLPHVAMRKEVAFKYVCKNTQAYTVPFINTIHLTAKTEPLIAQDYVNLKNESSKTSLVIDLNRDKHWTPYVVNVTNIDSDASSVNLTTTSNIPTVVLRQSHLCEPVDPANGNWSCNQKLDTQLQVELAAGETKKIIVFVHARQKIVKKPVANRVYLEAHDNAGEVVSKTSMGISTIN